MVTAALDKTKKRCCTCEDYAKEGGKEVYVFGLY